MPLNKHFSGHGKEVMASMEKTYGDKATADRVFYATENKQKNEKESSGVKASMKKAFHKKGK